MQWYSTVEYGNQNIIVQFGNDTQVNILYSYQSAYVENHKLRSVTNNLRPFAVHMMQYKLAIFCP